MFANVAGIATFSSPRWRVGFVVAAIGLLVDRAAAACPFCNVVTPTFAERRESATVCALAEVVHRTGDKLRFQLHRVHQGETRVDNGETIEFDPKLALKRGDLAILLGSEESDGDAASWRWEAVPVSEISYRYFAAAPSLRVPAAERLRYFAPYLESGEQEVAADAFAEFGRAPLEAVEAVADGELIARARQWVQDGALADERRGGYALLLGLARSPADRQRSATLLRRLIEEPGQDFRAGFDGVLGAYLLLEPEAALQFIDARFISAADARPGDTRHALNALRFCMEYHRGPDRDDILEVLRRGLARPAFAADIVVDLARWEDWTPINQVASLYDPTNGKDGAQLRRAVIGYLKRCPHTAAKTHLESIQARDPDGAKEAERRLNLPVDR